MSSQPAGQGGGGDWIVVKGARTHNLKNITVRMPRGKMVAVTGLSGSGKSSLAFDTIFAEGQRRYVESLSSYARQFLEQMQKPDVDEITGLSPAISIDQKSRSNNPRSTVATITEIYDYLRILFARVGRPHCPKCGNEIKRRSKEEIIDAIMKSIQSLRQNPKDTQKVKGVTVSKDKVQIFAPVVVGRKGEYYQLLYDLLGKGYEVARVDGEQKKLRERIVLKKTETHDIDVLVDEFYVSELTQGGKDFRERLSESVERAIHEADGMLRIVSPGEDRLISTRFVCPYDGYAFPEVEPRLFSFNSPYGACPTCNGLGTVSLFSDDPCPDCKGARLRPEAEQVFFGDPKQKTSIVRFVAMTISEALRFVREVPLSPKERDIAKAILREIEDRLRFMNDVGIEYLQLSRRAHTLSGGEAQRIRLASQLGSGLVGALYVLDEPTIGLHSRDNDRLIKTLTDLRDLGNTIVVVEHDEDTLLASDYLIDIGPGAGIHGGNVIVADWLKPLMAGKVSDKGSSTVQYLRGDKSIPVPGKRRSTDKGALKVRGGKVFNIENLSVDVPLGRFVCVTGVSGSGKSSFVYEILHKNLEVRLDRKMRSADTYNCQSFTGSEYLGRSILIDQSPIGRTPRSNPATYTGAWTFVRDLFAEAEESRYRGWKSSRFSFNVPGGRCESCEGNGEIAVEMHFLPTVYVPCDICGGKRFMKETLDVKYKGKNIYDILRMTVEEALKFFEDIPAIYDRLKTMGEVGLGYLELGQSATTLSGGEAQRVKISAELYRTSIQKSIYILDEPTIGLHYEDVRKLIEIVQKLVEKGNSVLVIEHNLDVIKCADYLIDIGPEGGNKGGKVVAKGTPEEVAATDGSYTGQYLRPMLKKGRER
jgi:excinuclease ABC subunit A